MAYDNTTREATALANRRRIRRPAADSFVDREYAATSLRAVVESAGLSQESVFKIYGGKGGLLKAVYDTSMAGDDDVPVPIAEREHAHAVRTVVTPPAKRRSPGREWWWSSAVVSGRC